MTSTRMFLSKGIRDLVIDFKRIVFSSITFIYVTRYVESYNNMLGQTYMVKDVPNMNRGGGSIMVTASTKPKRHNVGLNTEVFTKLNDYVTKWGNNTKEGIANMAVDDYVCGREKFGKMLAPHLILENSTKKAIFIYDDELNKTAVVRAKWRDVMKQGGGTAFLTLTCENCESDSCMHVRYALVLPDIIRIQSENNEQKTSSTD